MSDSEVKITQAPNVVKPTPGQPVLYANICGVSMTTDEAVLQFGLRTPDNPSEATGVATVYMSLPQENREQLGVSK